MVAICGTYSPTHNSQSYNKYAEKMEEDRNCNETDFPFKVPKLRKKGKMAEKKTFALPTSPAVKSGEEKLPALPELIREQYKEASIYKYKLRSLTYSFPVKSSMSSIELKENLCKGYVKIWSYLKKSSRQCDYIGILICAKSLPYGRIWMPFRSMKNVKNVDLYNILVGLTIKLALLRDNDQITMLVYIPFATREFNPKAKTSNLSERRLKVNSLLLIKDDNLNIPRCLISMLKHIK